MIHKRRSPNLAYRKCFFIATEGEQTEAKYFKIFKYNEKYNLTIIPATKNDHDSAPCKVLKRLEKKISDRKAADEVWIVIDSDSWAKKELDDLYSECSRKKYRMAVSNPKFEYWLLLHFEDGKGVNSKNCIHRLKKHLPHFDKDHVETDKLKDKINDAIKRAKMKDRYHCKWPAENGSTVYRLVEKLS